MDLAKPADSKTAGQVLDLPIIRSKTPTISYLGFRSTPDGREYELSVSDGLTPRLFVMLITHQAFAAHEARYQDGPDVCFSKLSRDLAADPELVPITRLELTLNELRDYCSARDRPSSGPKRRLPRR